MYKHLFKAYKSVCKFAVAVTALPLLLLTIEAQALFVPPSMDTFIDSTKPTINSGASPTLSISKTSTTLLQFNLASLPAGTLSSSISKATLWLWGGNQNAAGGSISIYAVNSAWTGSSVTYNTRPTFGSILSTSAVTGYNNYTSIDITNQVKSWLANPNINFGIALTPASNSLSFSYSFDAKENIDTAHMPMLDITLFSGKTTATCLNANFGKICSCTGKIVSQISGGSCSATSDTGTCSIIASGMSSNNPIASCCVCAVP